MGQGFLQHKLLVSVARAWYSLQDVQTHSPWCIIAYDLALLSEYERHKYKHISVNLVGGIRNCIANDNLVEIHVRKIKQPMCSMGPNVTYKAAHRMAKCVGVLSAISDRSSRPKSGNHGEFKTASDVKDMACALPMCLPATQAQNTVHPRISHPVYCWIWTS